jgi:hypothetical protein
MESVSWMRFAEAWTQNVAVSAGKDERHPAPRRTPKKAGRSSARQKKAG